MRLIGRIVIAVWLLQVHAARTGEARPGERGFGKCRLQPEFTTELESYRLTVENIINETVSGSLRDTTWHELADFVDKFGPRLTGTQVLEDAIDYVLNRSATFGLENVHGEPVTVPHWVRGSESATLLRPRRKNIAILGLGYSVGTPDEGITAEAVVVRSFDELEQRKDEVPGKIVVYNQKYVSYEETVQYRSRGATKASQYGAVAALVRSVTPYSLYTPHTGMQTYGENVTKIPVACITAEDAMFLHRLAKRGQAIEINLKMEAKNLPPKESRNVIAEIVGSEAPEKVVVVSGHVDSWDVGEGAMDDGGGAFISFGALRVLKHLNYRPRRTVRMIMWTAEELGRIGARHYIEAHKDEQTNLQFVMESDSGTFNPLGLYFSGSPKVKCVLENIMGLLGPLGKMGLRSPSQGPDIEDWIAAGVPGGSLWNDNEKYFNYHHSNADTMLAEDPNALNMGTALFAAVSYVLADMSVDLPHQN